MAQGFYRMQTTFLRNSGVAEDVATIDLAVLRNTDGYATLQAASPFTETLANMVTADTAAFDDLRDDWDTFLSTWAGYAAPYASVGDLIITRLDSGHPTPNTPVYTADLAHAGIGADCEIPQAAATVTLRTNSRRHWGRFYLPCLANATVVDDGTARFEATFVNDIGGAFSTFVSSAASDNWFVYVQQAGISSAAGRAITQVRMDNVPDVIRRRRWDRSSGTYIADV